MKSPSQIAGRMLLPEARNRMPYPLDSRSLLTSTNALEIASDMVAAWLPDAAEAADPTTAEAMGLPGRSGHNPLKTNGF
jgi:hypothetical protein